MHQIGVCIIRMDCLAIDIWLEFCLWHCAVYTYNGHYVVDSCLSIYGDFSDLTEYDYITIALLT